MFKNTNGPNRVQIDNVYARSATRPSGRIDRGTIVLSQNAGRITISLLYDGRTVEEFEFSKRNLAGLTDRFNRGGDFVFQPFSAGGNKIEFSRPHNSRDFGLEFSDKWDTSPQVEDFVQALETMKGEPTDLYRMYPEIAKAADAQTSISDKAVWGLSFRVNGRAKSKKLLRYRGNPTSAQVAQLMRIAGVKVGSRGKTNREWTEYTTDTADGSVELVDQHMFDFAVNHSIVRTIVNGFFDANHYYVNGMEVPKSTFDFRISREDSFSLGDVVVAVSDRGGTVDDGLEFSEMPTVMVYKAVLDGPYTLPGFAGNTPLGLFMDDDLSAALDLDVDDNVICPRCGKPDCSDHNLSKGSLVFVRRNSQDSFLYAFQADLRGNATDKLVPLAPAVIGRKVRNLDWPNEVAVIEINGVDTERVLCSKSIRSGDTVKIVIK